MTLHKKDITYKIPRHVKVQCLLWKVNKMVICLYSVKHFWWVCWWACDWLLESHGKLRDSGKWSLQRSESWNENQEAWQTVKFPFVCLLFETHTKCMRNSIIFPVLSQKIGKWFVSWSEMQKKDFLSIFVLSITYIAKPLNIFAHHCHTLNSYS